ncbi:hypothetical protein HYV89_03565 [Candidatus Woesearchaeota archaeon]|nr:hypothetical protein [Candidatus Woesearchaeota archaeon]
MVSLVDSGLGEFLIPVFIFILIYAIIFSVLRKSKFLGDDTNINAVVAFVLSALFAIVPGVMEFISIIAPWFVVMVIVAFSILLVFMFGGVKGDTIESIFKNSTVYWTIIMLSIIILIGGLTSVYGPLLVGGTPAEQGPGSSIHRAIFNAKVLTTVIVLIIFAFAVRLLSFESLRES